mgnify:CR=1 FL=1
MRENPLREIHRYGQSVWLDVLRRALLTSGELKRLIEAGEVTGVTSNPTIFEKAIAGSTDYDQAVAALLRENPRLEEGAIYEALAVEDIRAAADLLRPVYEETAGEDGFACLEVSPHLAHDTQGTVAEARRLFAAVGRPNVMIKVPGTAAGLPAISTLIAEGINVNVTLMFSLRDYENVSEAYLQGLERLAGSGGDPRRAASVASFFLSRIDSAADRLLPEGSPLRGKTAIANAKAAYARFEEVYATRRFAALKEHGARLQRLLWASTGTKDPRYRDVMYVEALIGPGTVNTMPLGTLDACRDHCRPRLSVTEGLPEAFRQLAAIEDAGVDLIAVTSRLQEEGVALFARSFDSLLETLAAKRRDVLARRPPRQSISLGAFEQVVQARLRAWDETGLCRRIWQKDSTVWVPDPEVARRTPDLTDRLGWLVLPEVMAAEMDALNAFAEEIAAEGFDHVVLLGMGGSSLAPQVFMSTFSHAPGRPPLTVLDSSHPAMVRRAADGLDLARTLFIVSSKSGGTIEPLSLFRFFYEAVGKVKGDHGRNFVAVTDPGSGLEALAAQKALRRVFSSPPEVGGRYSALSVFGLVPTALIGVDLPRLLDRALTMAQAAHYCVPTAENPALALGAALGELALAGRDKVTFFASPSVVSLGTWLEQLLAESTGKHGKGLVPVEGEPPAGPEGYGQDRFFVYLRLEGDDNEALDKAVDRLEAAGHPVAHIRLECKENLGGEFFRWEMATAAAGAALGINPFDQPDVELAKRKARELMAAFQKTGRLPAEEPALTDGDLQVFGEAGSAASLAAALQAFLEQARPGDYVALMAYTPYGGEIEAGLGRLRLALRDRLRLATTVGYGPRFLHSTGQLHKGGPNTGLFIQITHAPEADVAIPGEPYSFGTLIAAQAQGDYQALRERGRRLIRFHIKGDVAGGLRQIEEALQR